MNPSEIRDYIGRQHLQLRILFTEVENACRGSDDPRPLVLKLVREVLDHIALENRLLVPALREVDGWGPVRADRVLADHTAQREQLIALRELAKRGSAQETGASALQLIAALIPDMNDEERDLLNPDLLRDDVVVVHQSDG